MYEDVQELAQAFGSLGLNGSLIDDLWQSHENSMNYNFFNPSKV